MKTREEAVKWLEETIQDTDTYWESCSDALQKELDEQKEVFLVALTALRPVSRERLEKMRSEWVPLNNTQVHFCESCGASFNLYSYCKNDYRFCPYCGAPMTDEAVQMVIERMEALKDADD